MSAVLKVRQMLAPYELAASVLEVLPLEGCPESTIYIGLGSNYDLSMSLLDALKRAEAVVVKNHYVKRGPNYDKALANSKQTAATIRKIAAEKGIQL